MSVGTNPVQWSMLVYPLPMREQCMIGLPNTGDDSHTLYIYDMDGKQVMSEHFKGSDYILQRNSLKSGIYVLKVLSENGAHLYQSKLVVR